MSREHDDSLDAGLAALRPRVPEGFADRVLAQGRVGYAIEVPVAHGSRRGVFASLAFALAAAASLLHHDPPAPNDLPAIAPMPAPDESSQELCPSVGGADGVCETAVEECVIEACTAQAPQ